MSNPAAQHACASCAVVLGCAARIASLPRMTAARDVPVSPERGGPAASTTPALLMRPVEPTRERRSARGTHPPRENENGAPCGAPFRSLSPYPIESIRTECRRPTSRAAMSRAGRPMAWHRGRRHVPPPWRPWSAEARSRHRTSGRGTCSPAPSGCASRDGCPTSARRTSGRTEGELSPSTPRPMPPPVRTRSPPRSV